MCLGIPGRIVEIMAGNAGQLAMVDVLGVQRPINLGMLENPNLAPGSWILIHMGFALRLMGSPGEDQHQFAAEDASRA
jgi:hydrogenase expression/formation protein HypC